MGIDYKTLLPRNIRSGRWGEFIEAFQSVSDELDTDKIEAILNQFKVGEATEDELKELARMLGFYLSVFTGYTQTSYYLKKEVLSIVPRIKYKNTRKGYQYILNIFNLIGEIYPTTIDENDKLPPIYNYEDIVPGGYGVTELDQEEDNILFMQPSLVFDVNFEFDAGAVLDIPVPVYGDPPSTGLPPAYLDTLEFPILDIGLAGGGTVLTRHLILEYKHKWIEEEGEFITLNTLKAMRNDVDQMRRRTEIVYFQPVVEVNVTDDNLLVTQEHKDYQDTITSNSYSRLIPFLTELSNVTTVKFGTGSYTPMEIGALTSLSDVQNSVLEFNQTDEMYQVVMSELLYDSSILITEKYKIPYKITEFALFNNVGHMIMYATFPILQWDEEMYSSIRIKVNLQTV